MVAQALDLSTPTPAQDNPVLDAATVVGVVALEGVLARLGLRVANRFDDAISAPPRTTTDTPPANPTAPPGASATRDSPNANTGRVDDDAANVYPVTPNSGPRITIRDHYNHHNDMRADVVDQLENQGFRVADGEASFGNACGVGRCRPDILYEAPDGTVGIIEIKTGNADLSIRQTEIFPQIENGDAIPRGAVADRFGLTPGVPLREQGYPNGIPIEVREFTGAGQ